METGEMRRQIVGDAIKAVVAVGMIVLIGLVLTAGIFGANYGAGKVSAQTKQQIEGILEGYGLSDEQKEELYQEILKRVKELLETQQAAYEGGFTEEAAQKLRTEIEESFLKRMEGQVSQAQLQKIVDAILKTFEQRSQSQEELLAQVSSMYQQYVKKNEQDINRLHTMLTEMKKEFNGELAKEVVSLKEKLSEQIRVHSKEIENLQSSQKEQDGNMSARLTETDKRLTIQLTEMASGLSQQLTEAVSQMNDRFTETVALMNGRLAETEAKLTEQLSEQDRLQGMKLTELKDWMLQQIGELTGRMERNEQTMTEVFQSVSNGKAAIASAITDKGVITQKDAEFQTMAEHIRRLAEQCYRQGQADGSIQVQSLPGKAETAGSAYLIGIFKFHVNDTGTGEKYRYSADVLQNGKSIWGTGTQEGIVVGLGSSSPLHVCILPVSVEKGDQFSYTTYVLEEKGKKGHSGYGGGFENIQMYLMYCSPAGAMSARSFLLKPDVPEKSMVVEEIEETETLPEEMSVEECAEKEEATASEQKTGKTEVAVADETNAEEISDTKEEEDVKEETDTLEESETEDMAGETDAAEEPVATVE
ncbi:MAG: hypothetical protein J6B10_03225 [Lachnospiraceae bacterium]|nr:hypothetical protein [Lachnospiraceae bacterium]